MRSVHGGGFFWANIAEAALWFAFALLLARRARASGFRSLRRVYAVAAMLFMFFGLSDLVETRTGAWWQPAWLLAWNVVCVTGLAACLVAGRRIRHRARALPDLGRHDDPSVQALDATRGDGRLKISASAGAHGEEPDGIG